MFSSFVGVKEEGDSSIVGGTDRRGEERASWMPRVRCRDDIDLLEIFWDEGTAKDEQVRLFGCLGVSLSLDGLEWGKGGARLQDSVQLRMWHPTCI